MSARYKLYPILQYPFKSCSRWNWMATPPPPPHPRVPTFFFWWNFLIFPEFSTFFQTHFNDFFLNGLHLLYSVCSDKKHMYEKAKHGKRSFCSLGTKLSWTTCSDENILCHQNIRNIVSSKISWFLKKNVKFPDFSLTGKMFSNFPWFPEVVSTPPPKHK